MIQQVSLAETTDDEKTLLQNASNKENDMDPTGVV
jgi:hypothetical protein